MKEQVTDIIEILKGLNEEVKSLHEHIVERDKEICKLKYEIDALKLENKELKKKLKDYEGGNRNTPVKDSSNSSIPPSKEPIKAAAVRRTQSLKEKSDRNSGGQIGHKGCTLNLEDECDETIDHAPMYCPECGAAILDSNLVEEYSTQEKEIEIREKIKRHRHFSAVCSCGCHVPVANKRKRGGNAVTFGKKICAIVTYLSVVQCLPYKRIASLLKDVFNAKMSQGSIDNIIGRAYDKARPLLDMIKNNLTKGGVVGFDESGCYDNGKLIWSWIAQDNKNTYVFNEESRNAEVLENRFGDKLSGIIAVTDRHTSYFSLPFRNHQVCLVHFLRDLKYLGQINEKQTWSSRIAELFRKAIHIRNENPDKVFDKKSWHDDLDTILAEDIEELGKLFVRLKKWLMKRRDYLFNFLENPQIPFHNNDSERGFRIIKVKQKISGTFRSKDGADAFVGLHSICDTSRKNNMSVFNQLLGLF